MVLFYQHNQNNCREKMFPAICLLSGDNPDELIPKSTAEGRAKLAAATKVTSTSGVTRDDENQPMYIGETSEGTDGDDDNSVDEDLDTTDEMVDVDG